MTPVSSLGVFIPSVKFLAMFVVAASLFQVVTSDSWCTSRSCGDNRVCCGNYGCVVAANCLGLYCSSGSDCSVGESCCKSECSNTSSCLGYFCTSDFDCSTGQSCCSNKCRDSASADCVGYSCSSTSDCDQWEFCCHGTCSKAECFYPIPTTISVTDNTTFIIIATVLGSLGFVFLVTLVIFICRRQRPAPVQVATVQERAQIYRPLSGQVPPSYQQGEQPPPNKTTIETNSGGVHPQNSYGAIPIASNLPV